MDAAAPAVAVTDWTGWRGRNRDAHVPWLPATLPKQPNIVWRKKLTQRGLGGVAATAKVVILSDRALDDTADAFYCLDAATGDEIWSVVTPAVGSLDYGNSPRATPLIDESRVYLAGAFGHVQCVELADGEVVWELDLSAEFEADERAWGYCASPLLVDGKLIVNPGAKDASLVALDAKTGDVVWKSPGAAASYGSFLAATFGGKKQIIGHDRDSLGGWDVASGKRLWRLPPKRPNDFNVPTPVVAGDKLIVTTENNGTRLFRFGSKGAIESTPVATNDDLAPDCHTPVVVGHRLFGIWDDLYCLDLNDGLKTLWQAKDNAFGLYASIIASKDRILVTGIDGELVLIDATADEFRVLGRTPVFTDDHGVYSHPALVGSRMYLRGTTEVVCIELTQK